MPKKKKKQKWVRFRHRIVKNVAFLVLYPYLKWKYRLKVEKFKKEKGRKYLILFNHQTALDQFIVGSSFRAHVYFVASEDLFSNGWISRLLSWAVAPIPIKKQATDARAVLNCMRVMKEGGTIAIAPEGNRTYSGKTEYIKPAIIPLVKALKMPLLLYRIEGGYGVHPRWSNKVRRGKMHAFVSRVVEPEEYLAMSDDELFELISKELYVNEGRLDYTYKSRRLAEYMERVFYVCPDCGLTTFRSDKDLIVCQKCGKTARYLPTKQFAGVNGEFPFEFTTEWYDYQSNFINALPLQAYGDKCLFKDEASIFEVILYDRKKILQRNTEIRLCADRISFTLNGEVVDLPYEKISALAVLGKNKLNIYYEGKLYQLKGDERLNALKYVHLYYRAKNILKGEEDGKFLGL